MDKVGARITIGAWTIDTTSEPHELVRVNVERAVDSPVGRCRVELYVAPPPEPGLLEQAVGAAASALGLGPGAAGSDRFTITVRGQSIAHDDPMTIELVRGDKSATVMTAKVIRVANRYGGVLIEGRGSMGALAALRLDAVHESQDVAAIANALAGAAGVTLGQVDSSDTYPYIVVHSGRSALDQLLALARLEGMSVFEDGSGKLHLRRLESTAADRTLQVGIDLLGVRTGNALPPVARVSVTGESPTSAKGTDTWHHLLKDPSGAQATVGEGSPALAISNLNARSTDAAERLARATVGAARSAATVGTVELLGDPTLELGTNVELKGAAWTDLNGIFKIVRLSHRLAKRQGFTTTLDVLKAGGSRAAGGGLLGAAAAAVGL